MVVLSQNVYYDKVVNGGAQADKVLLLLLLWQNRRRMARFEAGKDEERRVEVPKCLYEE